MAQTFVLRQDSGLVRPRYNELLMRRALANLLLVVWTAVSCPALSGSRLDLPACCRAGGKHHCMRLSPGMRPPTGDGFQPQAAWCPYRHFSAIASHTINALPIAAQAFNVSVSQSPLALAQSPELPRRRVGNVPERGPPLNLS
jgi:hypothetical protein